MYSNSGTLYPMLGVGSFMAMFWTGVVLGHELGVGCMPLLILGLLCGCIGTVCVCELQRRDRSGRPVATRLPDTAPKAQVGTRAGRGGAEQSPSMGGRLGAADLV